MEEISPWDSRQDTLEYSKAWKLQILLPGFIKHHHRRNLRKKLYGPRLTLPQEKSSPNKVEQIKPPKAYHPKVIEDIKILRTRSVNILKGFKYLKPKPAYAWNISRIENSMFTHTKENKFEELNLTEIDGQRWKNYSQFINIARKQGIQPHPVMKTAFEKKRTLSKFNLFSKRH